MTVFITGDRSLDPVSSVLAAASVMGSLAAANDGELPQIATGDLGSGVEAAVRYLDPTAKVFEADADEEGKPDLDGRHARVATEYGRVVVIHPDPLSSSVYRSAVQYWSDDALTVFP